MVEFLGYNAFIMIKGEITLAVLKLLQASHMTAAALLDALTYYEKGRHYRRLRHLPDNTPEYKPILQKAVARREGLLRLHKLISKLRSEGIVAAKGGRDAGFSLTTKGLAKLGVLEQRKTARDAMTSIAQSAARGSFKIIVFDIPEHKHRKRDALRDMLRLLHFTMLQKSVWAGNAELPESFLLWLQENDILAHVEIFTVTKEGTLKQLR
ncbi:MAG: hypothetical protein HYW56_00320 [Candidatus Harrisonbacteria bacterium]|nr:hypothetical protein [Candidatus Harrisonbacteria bacterium]